MTPFASLALSPDEAAVMLHISRRQVDRLINAGQLPARKLGQRTLIDREAVHAFYEGLPAKGAAVSPRRRARRAHS